MNKSNITFFLLGKKYKFNLKQMVQFINESQYWDSKEIELYQNQKLQAIIAHVYDKVPFYTKQFNHLGLKPSDINSKEDLIKLPIINKETVASNFADFLSLDFSSRRKLGRHTGGTTGLAFEFYNDIDSWAINWANKIRAFEWGGFKIGVDTMGVLAGGSLLPQDGMGFKARLWRYLQNFYSMPITHMTAKIMDGYLKELKKRKIKFLRGYPTAVYSFAKYVVSKNEVLPLTSVFTTAEMLYDHHRDMIRLAFGCEAFNEYGCGDGMGKAQECDAHDGLHIGFENSIMEIIKDNKPVSENQEGEVILTSLNDYSMPFIRYAPGDLAIKGRDNCECGRKLTKLNKIIGRTSDIIELSNGIILNGLSIPFEAWTKKIKQFQIVQVKPNKVNVLIIPLESFTKVEEKQVIDVMEYHCGEGIEIEVKLVDDIPVPKSGKYRYVVSQL